MKDGKEKFINMMNEDGMRDAVVLVFATHSRPSRELNWERN